MRTKYRDPVRRAGRRNLLAVLALCAVMTLFVMPSDVFATQTDGSTASVSCAQSGASQVDLVSCLPAGRWGGSVGSLTSRIDPSGSSLTGKLSNAQAMFSNMTRTMLPNMLMMVTQVCWNSALALSQFAASFDPLTAAGANLDSATAKLIDSLFTGSIPAAIAVLAIIAWVAAAGFQIGSTKEASKRILIMVLCFSSLTILGTGAAKTGENATEPATGSPWWVVRTINNTINDMTVGLDLDHLISGSDSMMSYRHGSGEETNCQDYVYAMDEQYKKAATDNKRSDESNVVNTINRIWEETALRSWVTMQYGSPTESATTSAKVAENAQQAYCHVIEMDANTSPSIQRELTNSAMGLHIQDKAATFLFTENGWISPQDTRISDDEKTSSESEQSIRESRAAVFWETCTTNKYDDIHARDGWAELINNLGDAGSGEIKNGSNVVRVKLGSSEQSKYAPSNDDTIFHAADSNNGESAKEATSTVCQTILKEKTAILNHDKDYNSGSGASQSDTNYGDAASIGWRFDVPNVNGTWREANLSGEADDTTANGAAKKTLGYLYGNEEVDTLGACGSLIGAICNMLVWGALSLILMLSKLMLLMMVMFLAVAFLVQAFPIGEKPKKALKNWVTYTCNLSMTGALYGALGTIATFICQLTLRFTADLPNSFMYQLIAGLSPVLGIAVIGMFCSKVLKCGNPFSVNAIMGMAGGTAMASGIRSGMSMLGRSRMVRSMRNGARHAGGNVGRLSTNGTGAGAAHNGARQSGTILSRMSDAQQAAFSDGDRNSMNRGKAEYEDIQNHGRRSKDWARMDPGTVRGSLAGARLKMEEANDRLHGRLGGAKSKWRAADNTEMFRYNILQRHPGMSIEDAQRKAERMNSLNNAGRRLQATAMTVGAGAAMGGSGIAFAVRAAGSAPLRGAVRGAVANGAGVAFRGAKVAAGVAATSALLSNPITVPLGWAAAGRLVTSRETWSTVAAASNGAYALKKGLKRLGREDGGNPSDDADDAGAGGGSPTPTPTVDGGGAGSATPTPDDAPTEVIPGDGGAAPTTRLPKADTPRPVDDAEAFNQVRSGMMSDFMNNRHMTQDEAERAFRHAVDSGDVEDSVQAFIEQREQRSRTRREDAAPSSGPKSREPLVDAETGEIVGETLPSGTVDAAVAAASTWRELTGNDTPMPDSVNDALQQAHMRENPVLQTPEEHLRMAQAEWASATGLPGSTMPPTVEHAMNWNAVAPDRMPDGDASRSQGRPSVA